MGRGRVDCLKVRDQQVFEKRINMPSQKGHRGNRGKLVREGKGKEETSMVYIATVRKENIT